MTNHEPFVKEFPNYGNNEEET